MKKYSSYRLTLVGMSLITLFATFSGCSSAKKEAEHPLASNAPAQAPASPVDLGASSSGRGL
jgi:hypothetical protein